MTGKPSDALSSIPRLAHSPPHSHSQNALIGAMSISRRSNPYDLRPYLERDALDQAGRRASDEGNGGSEHAAESAQERW
jgi:hypothetical protein